MQLVASIAVHLRQKTFSEPGQELPSLNGAVEQIREYMKQAGVRCLLPPMGSTTKAKNQKALGDGLFYDPIPKMVGSKSYHFISFKSFIVTYEPNF